MRRGEIHLVPFEYSDLRGSKREVGDIPVQDWRSAGLLKASVVRSGRLRVLEQRLLTAARGSLSQGDLDAIDDALKAVSGL